MYSEDGERQPGDYIPFWSYYAVYRRELGCGRLASAFIAFLCWIGQ